MSYLTFTVEAQAVEAEKQIWINKVKQRASDGDNLVGTGLIHYTDLSALNDDQISQLKIYSSKQGMIQSNESATTMYAKARKVWQVSKWYFPKPDTEFMTDVQNYTEEKYNPDWEEPFE